jgi:hypothetical protein
MASTSPLDGAMIVRLTRGKIRAGNEAQAFEQLRATVANAPRTDGLEQFVIARRIVDGRLELLAVTTWRDLDAMRAVMGDDWMTPSFSPALDALIESSSVDHFETIAEGYQALASLQSTTLDVLAPATDAAAALGNG